MKLRGFDDLDRRLRNLPQAVQRDALGHATDVGARLLQNAARSKAPRRSGFLRMAIQSQRHQTGKTRAVSQVGVTRDAFYGHMVEYGTPERTTKRGAKTGRRPSHYHGKLRGSVRAQPFMRPAWDGNKERIVDAMGEVLKRRIERASR